ncbi:hypothetical protein JCM3774_001748 [Rhodotorula dairenensis]
MAHALLLSPATRFDSPDSSGGSLGASSLSPATPPPPSLDFLEDLHGLEHLDTPTRTAGGGPTHSTTKQGQAGLPSNPLPEWLTDELEHEWLSSPQPPPPKAEDHDTRAGHLLSFVVDDGDDDDASVGEHDAGHETGSGGEGSTTFLAPPPAAGTTRLDPSPEPPETPAPNRFPWQSQPRVPSALRHGFTAASSSPSTSVVSTPGHDATDAGGNDDGEEMHTRDMSIASALTESGDLLHHHLATEPREAADEADSSAQSSVVVNSVVDRGSAAAGRGDNDQLQAAVRALRGPNGGLFAATTEGETAQLEPKGLLGLFQPPSPPQQNATPLPKSTRPAPSLSDFTFSAPEPLPQTSWNQLDQQQQSPSSPDHETSQVSRVDFDATPVARSSAPQLATPKQGPTPVGILSSPTGGPAAVGKRERFLKRSLPPSHAEPPASPPPNAAVAHAMTASVTHESTQASVSASETTESSDEEEDHHHYVGAVPAGTSESTTTTDDDESSSDEDDDADELDKSIRSGGANGALLLAESKPGMGWSSDEDDHDGEFDDRQFNTSHSVARQQSTSLYEAPPRHALETTLPRGEDDGPTPHSPARIPLPATTAAGAGAARASTHPPPSPLKLFQPIYDTLTRSHLAALVDEIDTLGQPHREGGAVALLSDSQHRQQPGDVEPPMEHHETSDEGFLGEEGEKRSSKRIRLSPSSRTTLERIEEQPSDRGGIDREEQGEDEEDENDRSVLSTGAPISVSSRRRTSRSRKSPGPTTASARRPPLNRRRRDAYHETERIMDRIRRREDEAVEFPVYARPNRRNQILTPGRGGNLRMALQQQQQVHRSPSSRSSLRISGPQQPPLRTSSSSVSPPTLPLLAAAASASIRSALSASPAPPSPSLSHGLPSTLNEYRKGSLGRRQFARTPISSQTRPPRLAEDAECREVPSPTSTGPAPPPQTVQPTRNVSLTHLHPQSSTTQRLLASAGCSARDKGLVFDAQQGRWIRTRRSYGFEGSAGRTRGPVPGANAEEEEAEEEDPFRDFSEIQSGDRSTVSRAAILPAKEETALALNGLGITEGTPPLSTVKPAATSSTREAEPAQPSPRGGFESPPVEARPADERPEEPLLQLESEDSATWCRGDAEQMEQSARQEERSRSPSAGSAILDASAADESAVVESSMLNLYRRAHEVPSEDATDEGLTATSLAPNSDKASPAAPSQKNPVQPPRSALKNPRSQSEAARGTATPLASRVLAATGPPRSVSFSDGKTSGKIEGLGGRARSSTTPRQAAAQPEFMIGTNGGPGSLQFDGLETQSESEHDDESEADRTVTQVGTSAAAAALTRDPSESRINHSSISYTSSATGSPTLPLTGSRNGGSRTFVRTRSQTGNATFLTECSFGVSHDRLLQYITDVEPFEPDWEGLRSIDLSGKRAQGVVRLKEFLPNLDEVNLNDNEIAYLTGIPPSLRTLLAASNRLTDLTSFQHLSNLERLDISNNQLESVRHLACLRHLRELKADGNRISSLDGLADLDSLVRVSLKNNDLTDLDFGATKWTRLETLHLARNQISRIRGLERLQSLSTINLDHNRLTDLSAASPLPRLRVLRVCQNPLPQLDVAFAPRLRTLFADSAQLGAVQGVDELRKLENLSVRDQSGGALTLSMPHLRDVKRLYLSGNPLPRSFPSEKFFNLVYLELAMCQLSSLPDNLAAVIPNVRVLNLNHNFLSDLTPLSGLTRCTRLSLVGARISKARHLASVLSAMPELEVVDLRMNPLTLAFYPPLVPTGESLLPAHAEHRILHPDALPSSTPSSALDDPVNNSSAWLKLDTKFRRSLPDEWYHRRAAYRAVVLQSAPTLGRLDGIDVAKERGRLAHKLERLVGQPA